MKKKSKAYVLPIVLIIISFLSYIVISFSTNIVGVYAFVKKNDKILKKEINKNKQLESIVKFVFTKFKNLPKDINEYNNIQYSIEDLSGYIPLNILNYDDLTKIIKSNEYVLKIYNYRIKKSLFYNEFNFNSFLEKKLNIDNKILDGKYHLIPVLPINYVDPYTLASFVTHIANSNNYNDVANFRYYNKKINISEFLLRFQIPKSKSYLFIDDGIISIKKIEDKYFFKLCENMGIDIKKIKQINTIRKKQKKKIKINNFLKENEQIKFWNLFTLNSKVYKLNIYLEKKILTYILYMEFKKGIVFNIRVLECYEDSRIE